MFVFSTTLLCIYVFAFCWVYIRKITESEHTTIWKAMLKTPASIVLIIYTFIAMWFVAGLTAFHLYLISTNQVIYIIICPYQFNPLNHLIFLFSLFHLQTTYENFRYRYDRRSNPHNKGVVDNFKETFCSAIPPSKNDFRAMVHGEEPPLPPRSVAGGFMSPNMGKANNDDIEMGRKAVWADMGSEEHGDAKNGNDERLHVRDRDGELGELSPDVRTTVDEQSDRHGVRRSSWGRKSGSWDMSPEVMALAARVVEQQNQNGGGSSSGSGLAAENRPT